MVSFGKGDMFKASLVCFLAQAKLESNDAQLGSGPTFDQSIPLPPLMMYDLAQPCRKASHSDQPDRAAFSSAAVL